MEMADGIFLVRIPLPFQLDSVNCYLIRDADGWFAVDAGLNYEAGREAWARALGYLGLEFTNVKRILVTHFHPDHYGAAGWLQERSRARVYMSKTDFAMAKTVWNESGFKAALNREHMISNGVPKTLALKIEKIMRSRINWVKPDPQVNLLEEGDSFRIGDDAWEVLITPGHSRGHVCLYSAKRKIIISGDQLLLDITSNISFFPGSSENPLLDYLCSLSRLKRLDIDLLLPAHGHSFKDAGKRICGLFRHHKQRLESVYNAVGSGKTAFDISQEVFGRNLDLNDLRFALGETIAHLKYLVVEGRLREDQGKDLTVYSYN